MFPFHSWNISLCSDKDRVSLPIKPSSKYSTDKPSMCDLYGDLYYFCGEILVISVYNSSSRLSITDFLSSHSQTTITRQPRDSNFSVFSMSRCLFRLNLASQKSSLTFGIVKWGHPSWWCQKHPWTNTTVWYLGNTTSGWPGYRLSFFLKRKPREKRYFRTMISGFVSLPLFRDIT